MTQAPKKFDFDNEFGSGQTPEDIQSITPKQLKKVIAEEKQRSFSEGYEKGVEDMKDDCARKASDQMVILTSRIEDLIANEQKLFSTCHHEIAGLVKLILNKMSPKLMEFYAQDIVENVLDQALKSMPTKRDLVLIVNPKIRDHIDGYVADYQKSNVNNGFTITVNSDESLSESDCRISFTGGGMEFYGDKLVSKITGYINDLTPRDFCGTTH